MAVSLPVVVHGGFLGHRLGVGQGQGQGLPVGGAGGKENLHCVQGLADVPAAAGGDIILHPGFYGELQIQLPAHVGDGPVHRLFRVGGSEGLKLKNGGAAQNCVEHIEIRVLRGGGNQGDLAVFDVLQQGLLLLFVEGLDLIQVQQHSVWRQHGIQL